MRGEFVCLWQGTPPGDELDDERSSSLTIRDTLWNSPDPLLCSPNMVEDQLLIQPDQTLLRHSR
jgi:hypothetical protein